MYKGVRIINLIQFKIKDHFMRLQVVNDSPKEVDFMKRTEYSKRGSYTCMYDIPIDLYIRR